MADWSPLGSLGAVISVAGGLGIALAIVFAFFRKTGNDILRTNIADADRRITTLEADEKDCKERLAKQDAVIAKQDTTISMLTEMVTSAAAVSELATTVAFNHSETIEVLRSIEARLSQSA